LGTRERAFQGNIRVALPHSIFRMRLQFTQLLLVAVYLAADLVITQNLNDKVVNIIRVSQNTLLASKPHGYLAGERVIFNGPAVVNPLIGGLEYFVIVKSGMPLDQFQVSVSFEGQVLALQDTSLEFIATVKYVEPKICNLRRLSAGWTHTCAIVDAFPISSNGALYYVNSKLVCWGDATDGKLVPYDAVQSSISDGWMSISASSRMSCGINTAGLAFCWGYPGRGIAGDGRLTVPKPPEWERNSKGGLQFGEIVAAATFTCSSLNETRKQYGSYGALLAQMADVVPSFGTTGSRITIFGVNFDTAATSRCTVRLQNLIVTSCFLRTAYICEFVVPNITDAGDLITPGIAVDTALWFSSGKVQRTPASIRLSFTVIPAPVITSVLPASSVPGFVVTVFGENFIPNGKGSSCTLYVESKQASCLPATSTFATFICPDFSPDSLEASINISFSGGVSILKPGLLKFLPKTKPVPPLFVADLYMMNTDSLDARFVFQRDYGIELLQKLNSWDKTNRTIGCQGLLDYGQQSVPAESLVISGKTITQVAADWIAVRSSYYHVCGIRANGFLFCWGALNCFHFFHTH
jgi:hypothetical protein